MSAPAVKEGDKKNVSAPANIIKSGGNDRSASSKTGVRMSLRLYFSLAAITTLCFSCLFSCVVVCGVVLFALHLPVTVEVMVGCCLAVCVLTMVIGGVSLWFGGAHLIKPLKEISTAVKRVAGGHFDTVIARNAASRRGYQYSNEIDELSENFNTMVMELNNMDYMRKDFMSNVSHEIKTPVAAITGFTEILMDGGLSEEEERDYLALVNEESVRLSKLCEDMLRMSRLDSQEIVRLEDEVRVDEQIRKSVILLSERWEEGRMQYELDLEENTLISSRELLQQIWMNLIDNANKYSEAGKTIWIREYRRKNKIIVKVRDEGIGIAPEKIDRIFDRLYQCEESHKKKGSGLGLSIVKRIVDLLSGEIRCESRVGSGSTFTVVLPLNAAAEKSSGIRSADIKPPGTKAY